MQIFKRIPMNSRKHLIPTYLEKTSSLANILMHHSRRIYRTSTKSQSEIDRIIFILRHWETGFNELTKNLFQNEYPEGYGLATMYDVESYSLNGQLEAQYRLQRKLLNKEGCGPTIRTGSLIGHALTHVNAPWSCFKLMCVRVIMS
jgi:hypothetical protein